MSPRIRRLNADYQKIQTVFQNHPYIRLENAEGRPPEKYIFSYKVSGLKPPQDGEEPEMGYVFKAEVFLPLDYPRRPPFARMLTPVFHPNIDPAKICIGDHWSAGQSLAHLVVRIAEIICFQSYNIQSPLNGAAAAWAERHIDQLPLLRKDLTAGL